MAIPFPLNRLYLSQTLSEPAFGGSADEIFYVRMADGRRHIYRQDVRSGLAQPVTTEPAPAGGIGYGSGVYAVRGNCLVFAARGGQLHGLDLRTGEQWAISPAFEGVAAPAISPGGRYVAFLAEQGGHADVLLADLRGEHLPVRLSQKPWYAFNPAFSPDGRWLAWMEWDALHMPWDEARLVVARLARPMDECEHAAQVLPLQPHIVSRPSVAYASPQFSPDGQWLAYTSDESGWRSLWVRQVGEAGLGEPERLETGPGEIGGPDWVPNLIKMRWSDDGRALYAIRRSESRDCLLRLVWPERTRHTLDVPWTHLASLGTRGGHLVFIGARPDQPEAVITWDTTAGTGQARATSAVGLVDTASLAQPRVITWQAPNGQPVWGIHYPAQVPEGAAAPTTAGPRPLFVWVHGGPTSERTLSWEPQAQFFASRGWHYLLVNHRGGSGFGRAYQDLLNGQWGVVDVEDARGGAEHLVAAGLADRQRLVIGGGSAGGYTTLMALTQQPDFWAAGIALAGIGEMYELYRGSHRFEVNYEMGLIGRLPAAGPLWKQRSPLTHAANVRAPVLLLHGRDDKVVPVQHSLDYAEAVRRNRVPAEVVVYDGEGHTFVRESTRRDVIEKMERFLDKYVINLQG